jgi:hypothetical protein
MHAVERHAPAECAATADPVVVKLSFDMPWAVLPPIQRVFLYELPGGEVDGGGVAPQARFWDSFLKKKSEPTELGEI